MTQLSESFDKVRLKIQPPVVAGLTPKKLENVSRFLDRLRCDNKLTAKLELARLDNYFDVFHARLMQDAKELGIKTSEQRFLTATDFSHEVFRRIADRTGSTLLSEFAIMPQAIFKSASKAENTTAFSKTTYHRDQEISFGFIQVKDFIYDPETKKELETANSMSAIGLNADIVKVISKYATTKMFRALQAVATAANHDMQHHISSELLNPDISSNSNDRKESGGYNDKSKVIEWHDEHLQMIFGSDENIKSYESFLILNHSRMWADMAGSDQERDVEKQCKIFFQELKRLSKDMAKDHDQKTISQTVDYLGTLMGYALVRFLTLDHPIMDMSLRCLEMIDPLANDNFLEKTEDLFTRIEHEPRISEMTENYTVAGSDFLFTTMRAEKNYVNLKRLEIAAISPEIALLNSPAQEGSELAKVKARVPKINFEMMQAAALDVNMGPAVGEPILRTKRRGEKVIEYYNAQGKLHREDGPASTHYNVDGELSLERWYKNGVMHRDGGKPALTRYKVDGFGRHCEDCYVSNKLHNDSGPACITEYDGYKNYKYYNDDTHICEMDVEDNGRIKYMKWDSGTPPEIEDQYMKLVIHDMKLNISVHELKNARDAQCKNNGVNLKRLYKNDRQPRAQKM